MEEVETTLSHGKLSWAENRLAGRVEGLGEATGDVFRGCQPDQDCSFFRPPQCHLEKAESWIHSELSVGWAGARNRRS